MRRGDFNGDGYADLAVWRPSNGVWFIIRSTDNQVQAAQFGQMGDIPVNGDFNGDGKSDLTIYRPSNGYWYIARQQTGAAAQNFDSIQFGVSIDLPVAADYDNDGKTDIGVYRSNAGDWFTLKSSDSSVTVRNFGLSVDKPILAAYLP